jgi:hypothetical protein
MRPFRPLAALRCLSMSVLTGRVVVLSSQHAPRP